MKNVTSHNGGAQIQSQSTPLNTKRKKKRGGGWNKGKAQGQKRPFEPTETDILSEMFINEENWHDLALLSLGTDSFFRSVDLLSLRCIDVCYSTGQVKEVLPKQQKKTSGVVYPPLTPVTQANLQHWIDVSGKKSADFLFTGTKKKSKGLTQPITRYHLSRKVKTWAEWLGYPPDDYASHSLRRTKAALMYKKGEPIEHISELLGHKSTKVTLRYLGITLEEIHASALRHTMTRSFDSRKTGRTKQEIRREFLTKKKK